MTDHSKTIQVVGRYALYQAIASGGMATVFLGRLLGPVGFARTVAVKRLHPQFAADPEFVSMFLDEARLATRIRHPNVVPTLDVVATQGELFLVMEYVHGESLSKLMRLASEHDQLIPVPVVVAILSGALQGLGAAHEATSERGVPLQIVHRDVSPQNILLGNDGQARLLDFGVARAIGRSQTTRQGQVKGKLAYMPPEQLRGEEIGPATDVYAAAVVLWEALTGRRLFKGSNDATLVAQVLTEPIVPPTRVLLDAGEPDRAAQVRPLEDAIMRALDRDKDQRWQTARELARALEGAAVSATAAQVSDWVQHAAGPTLRERATLIAEIESQSSIDLPSGELGLAIAAASELGPDTAGVATVPMSKGPMPTPVYDRSPAGPTPPTEAGTLTHETLPLPTLARPNASPLRDAPAFGPAPSASPVFAQTLLSALSPVADLPPSAGSASQPRSDPLDAPPSSGSEAMALPRRSLVPIVVGGVVGGALIGLLVAIAFGLQAHTEAPPPVTPNAPLAPPHSTTR